MNYCEHIWNSDFTACPYCIEESRDKIMKGEEYINKQWPDNKIPQPIKEQWSELMEDFSTVKLKGALESVSKEDVESMSGKFMRSGNTIGGGDAGWIQSAYEQGVKDILEKLNK